MLGDAAKRTARFDDVRWLGEVDSTNLRLAELARAGDAVPDRTVLVAGHQTAGRGRRGRTWESLPGSSLLVSVLLGASARERADLHGLLQWESPDPDLVRRALVEVLMHGNRAALVTALDETLYGLRPRPAGYFAVQAAAS